MTRRCHIAAVPDLSGTRGRFHAGRFFHRQRRAEGDRTQSSGVPAGLQPVPVLCAGPGGWGPRGQQRSRIPGGHCAHTHTHTFPFAGDTPTLAHSCFTCSRPSAAPRQGARLRAQKVISFLQPGWPSAYRRWQGACPSALKQRPPGSPGAAAASSPWQQEPGWGPSLRVGLATRLTPGTAALGLLAARRRPRSSPSRGPGREACHLPVSSWGH